MRAQVGVGKRKPLVPPNQNPVGKEEIFSYQETFCKTTSLGSLEKVKVKKDKAPEEMLILMDARGSVLSNQVTSRW